MKKIFLALLAVYTLSLGAVSEAKANETAEQTETLSGWVQQNGNWYYYSEDTGEMVKGWLLDGGKWYYLGESGAMVTGFAEINGDAYFFNWQGAMRTGWISTNEKWYYANQDGALQTGWFHYGAAWYYLTPGGLATGWVQDAGKWYYLDGNGKMKTGWLLDSGEWYYLNQSGAAETGWLRLNGQYYYFNSTGEMATGWLLLTGTWYYFDQSGKMATGWKQISGSWYYFYPSSGAMMDSQFVDGYFLKADGRMSTAGSKEIVSIVESLKSSLSIGMTKSAIQEKLGSQFTKGEGIHTDEYWRFSFKVTGPGKYSVFASDGDAHKELGSETSSIVAYVYFSEGKAVEFNIYYFDANHKFHVFTHHKYDFLYY